MRFRAEPVALRLTHGLDPVTLVYHRRSGITHMLVEPVPQILTALDDLGAADAAMVAHRLAETFDLEADGAAEAVIAARLEELAALGLVVRETA